MPLEPAFALSATNPSEYWLGPEGPYHYIHAYLSGYGGLFGTGDSYTLPTQFANDEMIIGYDPAEPADENPITNYTDQMQRRNAFRLAIYNYELRDDHQYLLVYGFKKRHSTPVTVQFFVGTQWIQSESIDDDTETVALLIDSPLPIMAYVYARLASPDHWAKVGLTGIEGFII